MALELASVLHKHKLYIHGKKMLVILPTPAGMSVTKFSLAGNNEIVPGQEGFGK
jgi:hypothetical protein